ncbi:hypothetical protein BDR03DRAFT_82935 [Suillus americanus]|nr:hypothetical protein BDR03DRAFT_82935 [Suillus americanus]
MLRLVYICHIILVWESQDLLRSTVLEPFWTKSLKCDWYCLIGTTGLSTLGLLQVPLHLCAINEGVYDYSIS